MYSPTTRVLTVLEMLQSRQRVTGAEIAERLEVHIRTVRRYIAMLEELGIPVAAERGRYGAYRLLPGYKLPPLMLTAIVLYLTGGIPAVSPGILESSFQRDCEKANIMDVWHESVPERDGKATADLALPGCTTGIGLGQFHFADAREFAYFDRPAQARAQRERWRAMPARIA